MDSAFRATDKCCEGLQAPVLRSRDAVLVQKSVKSAFEYSVNGIIVIVHVVRALKNKRNKRLVLNFAIQVFEFYEHCNGIHIR